MVAPPLTFAKSTKTTFIMIKAILSAFFVMLLSTGSLMAQNSPLCSGKDIFDKFTATSEVIMDVQGFTYKYSGDWLRFMKLENDNAISFSRGRVTHHYDLRRVVLLQEEGNFVKVFVR
jgi:hypothetical protein